MTSYHEVFTVRVDDKEFLEDLKSLVLKYQIKYSKELKEL